MKVGILGAGKMGETVIGHLRHCPEVSEIVAHVVSEERLRDVWEKHGVPGGTDL
jgi:pyrroline-5-carboxylate reductase